MFLSIILIFFNSSENKGISLVFIILSNPFEIETILFSTWSLWFVYLFNKEFNSCEFSSIFYIYKSLIKSKKLANSSFFIWFSLNLILHKSILLSKILFVIDN